MFGAIVSTKHSLRAKWTDRVTEHSKIEPCLFSIKVKGVPEYKVTRKC